MDCHPKSKEWGTDVFVHNYPWSQLLAITFYMKRCKLAVHNIIRPEIRFDPLGGSEGSPISPPSLMEHENCFTASLNSFNWLNDWIDPYLYNLHIMFFRGWSMIQVLFLLVYFCLFFFGRARDWFPILLPRLGPVRRSFNLRPEYDPRRLYEQHWHISSILKPENKASIVLNQIVLLI